MHITLLRYLYKNKTIYMFVMLSIILSCENNGTEPPSINEPPIFISASRINVLDNKLETGYQAIATDKEGGTISYQLTGGVDQEFFSIDRQTGIVAFISFPDFNNPHDQNKDNSYDIEISALDNQEAESKLVVQITVTEKRLLLRIPIVVHVLYHTSESHVSNISNEKILSQISVLNEHFRRRNSDLENVPDDQKSIIADIEIEFEMAKLDALGNPTNGITRTVDRTDEYPREIPSETHRNNSFTNRGGHDAWPTDKYLNIWLYDGADRKGNVNLLGSGQYPGGDPLTDGVNMPYQVYGTIAPFAKNISINWGRTTTHEIGHWLDLRHKETNMNFMQALADDNEMVLFDKEQKLIIHELFIDGGGRESLYKNLTK